jgi:hypothetical protein
VPQKRPIGWHHRPYVESAYFRIALVATSTRAVTMMDEATFKDRVKRVNEINKVVEKLDPAIRGQAFALLEDYVGAGKVGARRPEKGGAEADAEPEDASDQEADLEAFVGKLESDAPADNAKALAAFHYKRYGKAVFGTDDINELAEEAGVTVPTRIDMTLKGAKVGGKTLFRQVGKTFTPTVHGEKFFKDTYKVKRGKLPKPKGKAVAE